MIECKVVDAHLSSFRGLRGWHTSVMMKGRENEGFIMVLKVKEGESDLNFVLVLTGEYKNGREGRNMLTRPCPESV
jgi:hypothetical protein